MLKCAYNVAEPVSEGGDSINLKSGSPLTSRATLGQPPHHSGPRFSRERKGCIGLD